MIIAMLFIGATALAWLMACGASLPVLRSSAEPDRRLRWVERHPEQVNSGDIRRLLARELPAEQVEMIAAKAQELGIRPFTMWMWIRSFDVQTLALGVAADLTHSELLSHLGSGVVPDVETLRVFAAINGHAEIAAAKPAARPARAVPPAAMEPAQVAARREAGVKRLTKMPEITDPGGWPFGALDLPARIEEPPATPGSYAA